MVIYLSENNDDTKMFISYNDGYYTIYGSRRDLANKSDIYNDYYVSYHFSLFEPMKQFIKLAFSNFQKNVNFTMYNIICRPVDICEYTFDELMLLSKKSEVCGYDYFEMTEDIFTKVLEMIKYI
jgi:hypothetical protein